MRKIRKKRIWIVFAATLLLCICRGTLSRADAGTQEKAVRVGYYILDGFQERDDNGNYTGYAYDYYAEIAQYTGWEYEFVEGSYGDCLNMLINGEIDIMSGLDVIGDFREKLEFSNHSMGTTQPELYAMADDEELTYDDYEAFDKKRVGVPRESDREDVLDEYCESRGISLEKVYAKDDESLDVMLQKGEIDMVFSGRAQNLSGRKALMYFDAKPAYFVTSKGSPLMTEMNETMERIMLNSPEFQLDLNEKYLDALTQELPNFTKQEMEYIASAPALKVVYDPSWEPIEYYNEKSGEYDGISADLFALVEKYSGLHFEYIRTENFSEALECVREGKADILTGITRSYSWGKECNVYLTNSYLEAPVALIAQSVDMQDGIRRLALPRDYYITGQLERQYGKEAITYYDSVEECVKAVSDGRADATYANSYVANSYLNRGEFRKLRLVELSVYAGNISAAVSKQCDPRLLSVINKSLNCVPNSKMDEILLNNMLKKRSMRPLQDFIYENPMDAVLIMFLTACFIMAVLAYIVWLKYRSERKIKETSRIDGLTGLYNRMETERLVRARLEEAERRNKKLLILSLDLDNFKQVNDTYGHLEGDVLLQNVARTFQENVGAGHIVGRMGGDEFLICIPKIHDDEEVVFWAEKMAGAIALLSQSKAEWNKISVSIGLVVADGKAAESFEALYQRVDEALYQAKNAGKNCYRIYKR